MYKNSQPSRRQISLPLRPKTDSMGIFCVCAHMSIYSKQSSRLPRCCLSYFLEAAARWPLSRSRLSAVSQSTVLTQRWSPAHAQSAAEKTGLGCGQYFQILFADG